MEHRLRGGLQGEGMKDNSGEPRDFRLPHPFLSLEAQPQGSTAQATSVSWFACWESQKSSQVVRLHPQWTELRKNRIKGPLLDEGLQGGEFRQESNVSPRLMRGRWTEQRS